LAMVLYGVAMIVASRLPVATLAPAEIEPG
jgi:hypothetical protein